MISSKLQELLDKRRSLEHELLEVEYNIDKLLLKEKENDSLKQSKSQLNQTNNS